MVLKVRKLCEHTTLMNIMIGLANKHETFPSVLADNGYQLDSICPSFLNKDGKEVNPDLIFKSHAENNLFIVECKTGTLQEEQAITYKSLTSEEVKQQNITTLPGNFSLDKTWVCIEKNLTKVNSKNSEWKLNFPIVCKFNTTLKKSNNIPFNSTILNSIFTKGIDIPNNIPTVYYSFSPEDPEEYILMHILPAIIKLSLNPHKDYFTLEELLKETHLLYEYLDKNEKTKLRKRLGSILSYLERSELKEFLNKVTNTPNAWQIIKNRILSFRNKCQKMIKEYHSILQKKEEEKKQKKISDF